MTTFTPDEPQSEELRGHYLWLTKALMTRMRPEDLSTETLASLVDTIAPDHARFIERQSWLSRKPGRPRPKVVTADEQSQLEGAELRKHHLWLLDTVMGRLRPEDLSTESIVSLVALLVPEHARFIGGQANSSSPQLRVVR